MGREVKVREYRSGQDRNGNRKTRRLEFEIIRDQVKRRKEAFIKRLQRQLCNVGACIVACGSADKKGYPRMNFLYKGKHHSMQVLRIIAILRNCAPIPYGHDVGHVDCRNRACVLHTELMHHSTNSILANQER